MNSEEQSGYAECVAFYLKLSKRPPLLLQRNLRTVLSYHRKRLTNSKQLRDTTDKMSSNNLSPTQQHGSSPRRIWNPKEIINILETRTPVDDEPILQLDITDIKDRIAKFRNRTHEEDPPKPQSTPAPIPASCSLTIWDSKLKTLVEQSRPCNIYPNTTEDEGRNATIKLACPFIVPLKLLRSEPKSSTTGELTFSTQFVIVSAMNTKTWPPLDMLMPEPKNPQLKDDGATYVKAPLLVAKWSRLPYLPEKEEDCLMELRARQDDKTYKPRLSLRFEARWLDPSSPLETYNKSIQPKHAHSALVSRPKADDVKIQTEWMFLGVASFMDKIVLPGYSCALCYNRRFREPTEYHFHLKNNHDRFDFDYSLKINTNDDGQSISYGVVRVKVAEPWRHMIQKETREMTWKVPKDPFDLEAYLLDDGKWLDSDSKASQKLTVPESSAERSSSREIGRHEPKKNRKRPIKDIPEIIIVRKRKFKVPPAPNGFSYYRTVSKVPLVEGEDLSESDDDINEGWLLEKHADTIDSFTDTLPKEKLFIQRFDRHMLMEDPCSDLHSEEALIRFCKQNTAWLRRQDMKLEFAKKTAALRINDLVSNDILVACWRIINDMSIRPEREDNLPETGTFISKIPDNEHIYGRCGECHGGIFDMRDLLYCVRSSCRNKAYHRRCFDMNSKSRPKEWVCPSCRINEPRASTHTNGVIHASKYSTLQGNNRDFAHQHQPNGRVTTQTQRQDTSHKGVQGVQTVMAKPALPMKPDIRTIFKSRKSQVNGISNRPKSSKAKKAPSRPNTRRVISETDDEDEDRLDSDSEKNSDEEADQRAREDDDYSPATDEEMQDA